MDIQTMTKHAITRTQQRGIPPLILEWLEGYGARTRAGIGTELLWFNKCSRKRLQREVGSQVIDRMGDLLDAYLVLADDGRVVTVGWRTKRIARH